MCVKNRDGNGGGKRKSVVWREELLFEQGRQRPQVVRSSLATSQLLSGQHFANTKSRGGGCATAVLSRRAKASSDVR